MGTSIQPTLVPCQQVDCSRLGLLGYKVVIHEVGPFSIRVLGCLVVTLVAWLLGYVGFLASWLLGYVGCISAWLRYLLGSMEFTRHIATSEVGIISKLQFLITSIEFCRIQNNIILLQTFLEGFLGGKVLETILKFA